jgi:hypothetical protein
MSTVQRVVRSQNHPNRRFSSRAGMINMVPIYFTSEDGTAPYAVVEGM